MIRPLLLIALSVNAALGQAVKEPAHVAVVGNEYAFTGFPTTIAAGPTSFSFENRGDVRHEMTILLLQPGLTMKDAIDAGPAATGLRVAESLIGLLIARKHEKAGGELHVDLKSGRRYLVICNLKNAPDSLQHSRMGMVTSFDVP
jgi:hypothetical protein